MFDPSAAEAAHWRHWFTGALDRAGIPADAMLELQVRPICGVAVSKVQLELRWGEDWTSLSRAEVLVPLRRLCGTGWSGWPAYLAAVTLLRGLPVNEDAPVS